MTSALSAGHIGLQLILARALTASKRLYKSLLSELVCVLCRNSDVLSKQECVRSALKSSFIPLKRAPHFERQEPTSSSDASSFVNCLLLPRFFAGGSSPSVGLLDILTCISPVSCNRNMDPDARHRRRGFRMHLGSPCWRTRILLSHGASPNSPYAHKPYNEGHCAVEQAITSDFPPLGFF